MKSLLAIVVLLVHESLHAAAAPPPEVRAYVNDSCIVADEPLYAPDQAGVSSERALPLIGIVVGKLAELMLQSAVKATAGKITARARKDTKYAVAKQINLFRADLDPVPSLNLNARLGCMTIVAGRFQADNVECAAQYEPRTVDRDSMLLPKDQWRTTRTNDSLENQLRRANVCMDGAPRSVYEARFEFSPDGTAYRLTNAGYRVNTLLTADGPQAQRSVFYTLEISQPSRDANNEVLSTAWVNLGMIKAGDRVAAPPVAAGQWLKVPPLSVEARRSYEEQTRIHQSVAAEIEALERAITRNRRTLAGVEERVKQSRGKVAAGLRDQAVQTEVQVQTLSAELEARKAEYAELPQAPLELMPVSIEVGVTEKTSEKRALLALGEVMDASSGEIASMAVTATAGLITRSVDAQSAAPPDPIERTRAEYFDAKVAVSELDSAETRQQLQVARENYNAARRAIGLGVIE